MNPDQTAPLGSSLIWIHSVCNIGFLSVQADKRAYAESHDWPEMALSVDYLESIRYIVHFRESRVTDVQTVATLEE